MKILVTGGAGFIGSHTVVELLSRGYDVVVVDNFCNSKRTVIDSIKRITNRDFSFYENDITDFESMDRIFDKEHIDCVVHFAALKSGADSIKQPGLYYHNNIDGLYVLMKLMEKYNVHKIVFSSSATIYGNSKNVPIIENEKIGDVISQYGMTKYLSELYLMNRSTQIPDFKAISLRYFNPIGAHPSGLIGEDSPDQIPNNLMLYTLKVANKELPYLNVFGLDYNTKDGSGIRDFIHVVDLAVGHIAAIEHFDAMETTYDVFNLGTGSGHSVLEFIDTFEKVNNVKVPYLVGPRRSGDVEISYASVDKAKLVLGWSALLSLEDCCRDAWHFYKKHLSK